MAGVELVKVAKRYGKQSVLHPLDLTIPDGSFTVLVGPSGCGKSTLRACSPDWRVSPTARF